MNLEHWGVEEAYKAYGPGMETKEDWEFLKNYTGRIWVIDDESQLLYQNNDFPKEGISIVKEEKTFKVKYHNATYNIILAQKNN